jgi:hypothetical protein
MKEVGLRQKSAAHYLRTFEFGRAIERKAAKSIEL